MFCPKCSQPQSSDTVRFCSRCGFELSAVKSLINGEEMPEAPLVKPHVAGAVQRKKDMTKGALLMFLSAFVIAAVTVDMPRSHSSRIFFLVIAWLALTLFINLGPLVRYFFGHDALSSARDNFLMRRLAKMSRSIRSFKGEKALPPSQSRPVEAFGAQAVNTGEMLTPPSVTDHTTNLLSKQ